MPRPIEDQRVVITGASSGIGRETAVHFARKGAWVVVAARNEKALRQVARECQDAGGRAHVVVTDVAEWEQVNHLAQEALAWGGRIDTWINNAAVSLYGTVEELSIEEIDRVIRVDLLGQIYGVKAVLPIMRRQANGTIVNVASAVAERSIPLQAPYCAAKHGIKGFTEALRMELDHDRSGIQVTLVLPSSINTPFFNHARSKMGVKPQPVPPVYDPKIVAEAILKAARHSVRDLYVGGAGRLLASAGKTAPGLMDSYMVQKGRMFRDQKTNEPDSGTDNLFEPSRGKESVRGDFDGKSFQRSFYTSAFALHPRRKRLALAGLGLLATAALVGLGRSRA